MEERCAIGTKCEGVCRQARREPEKCPAFYLQREPKPRKRVMRHKQRVARKQLAVVKEPEEEVK